MTVFWKRRERSPEPLALQQSDHGLAMEIIRALRAKAADSQGMDVHLRGMSIFDKGEFYEGLANELYSLAARPWFEDRR